MSEPFSNNQRSDQDYSYPKRINAQTILDRCRHSRVYHFGIVRLDRLGRLVCSRRLRFFVLRTTAVELDQRVLSFGETVLVDLSATGDGHLFLRCV